MRSSSPRTSTCWCPLRHWKCWKKPGLFNKEWLSCFFLTMEFNPPKKNLSGGSTTLEPTVVMWSMESRCQVLTASGGWLWGRKNFSSANTVCQLGVKHQREQSLKVGTLNRNSSNQFKLFFFLCSRLSFSPSLFCWFPGRRPDASEEPAFYHAGPWSLDEELVHDFSVGGINDLTAGLGSTKGHFIFWHNVKHNVLVFGCFWLLRFGGYLWYVFPIMVLLFKCPVSQKFKLLVLGRISTSTKVKMHPYPQTYFVISSTVFLEMKTHAPGRRWIPCNDLHPQELALRWPHLLWVPRVLAAIITGYVWFHPWNVTFRNIVRPVFSGMLLLECLAT